MLDLRLPTLADSNSSCRGPMALVPLALLLLAVCGPVDAIAQRPKSEDEKPTILAVVNGNDVHQGQLDLLMLRRGIPQAHWERRRAPMLEQLIDRKLIQTELFRRRARSDSKKLKFQMERTEKLLRETGVEPSAWLRERGMTKSELRKEVSFNVLWDSWTERRLTRDVLREHFSKQKSRYDGTKVRLSQILLRVDGDDESDWSAKLAEMGVLRLKIVDGETDFAEAARQHSDSPSGKAGGDVGWLAFGARIPRDVCTAVFNLEVGEVSEPVRSAFGIHLCKVTDCRPGDLSLEDARTQILRELKLQLWGELVAEQREKAEIRLLAK